MMNYRDESGFYSFADSIMSVLKDLNIRGMKNEPITSRIKSLTIVALFLITTSLLIVSEFLDIKHSNDLPSFAAHINPLLFHLSGLVKFMSGIKNVHNMEDLVDRMGRCHRLCLEMNQDREVRHRYEVKMQEFIKQVTKFTYIWISILIYGVVQWCINPIIYDVFVDLTSKEKPLNASFSRHLPYPGTFPWTIDNFSKYSLSFGFQTLSSIGTAFGIAVYDVFNIIFLTNAYINFQFLWDVLTVNLNLRKNQTSKSHRNFSKLLKLCVTHHIESLQFVEKLREVTNFTMFLLCFNSTIAICLVALEASTMKIDSSIDCIMKLISMTEYWSGILVELFIFCYIPTKIQESALKIADAFYMSNWEHKTHIDEDCSKSGNQQTKNDVKYIIQFTMARAQKPLLITGGLFYVLSLETFKALVGFSLSNVLVLRQLSEND